MKTNENELYIITREEIQEIASERIERDLTEDEIEAVIYKINEEVVRVMQETIDEVSEFSELCARDIGEKKLNPRYEIRWKNENAYQNTFVFTHAFESEEDARAYVAHEYWDACAEYKIEKVDHNVRELIVHHKNQLNGGDGFHMDVHDEPKGTQNAEALNF